ncbi:hypothetical protein AYL99_00555 [Fonsecaea erecta]|uniref:BZIP domain-containing protein n=1 Tax=Fonsecaea erecta TaxID=1367422 RepID=A0A178ZZE3_9EURO|nr:hypothetical protein AYL99_00555 [Fonsecaea erecta]OAP64583.1 hypothetical protein AYL99_00555 [Fonsecaea erecta]
MEIFQCPHGTTLCLGEPPNLDMTGYATGLPCLDQADLNHGTFSMAPSIADHQNGTPNSPEYITASFEPIGTIASRNERRKAQNRAAQRAFRVRQQQALEEAQARLRSLEEELEGVTGKKDHFERLYKSLRHEHEHLLRTFQQLLARVQSRSLETGVPLLP